MRMAVEYNEAGVCVDAKGIGKSAVQFLHNAADALWDDGQQVEVLVVPFIFSAKSKPELIANLIVNLENRRVIFPAIQTPGVSIATGGSNAIDSTAKT